MDVDDEMANMDSVVPLVELALIHRKVGEQKANAQAQRRLEVAR